MSPTMSRAMADSIHAAVERPPWAMAARAHLTSLVRTDELPGVQYVVVDRERVLFEAALGVRDVSTGAAMERSTIQMAYSITKAVTAIAAMQLVESGSLDLDRALDAYYPAHPYGSAVTIRSLLAQTSGVPNPAPIRWLEVVGGPVDRDARLREVLAKSPALRHPPGQRYAYSNIAYWLLERAIEAASGEDFGRYVRGEIFGRLGIDAQSDLFVPAPGESMATGHSRRYGLVDTALFLMSPSKYWSAAHGRWRRSVALVPYGRGYGGLFSSAVALAAVLEDMLRERPSLLSARTRDAMFTRQTTADGRTIDMTLGWLASALRGERYFGKQGGGLGFHGNVRVYPDRGLATVLLANRTEVAAGPIDARSDRIDAIVLDRAG